MTARHPDPQGEDLTRVAVRAVTKATAVGFLPAVCLAAIGGNEAVAVLLLGVSAVFVVGATAYEVGREWKCPTAPPSPPLGPGQVLSQAEAGIQLEDLISELWERDGCSS